MLWKVAYFRLSVHCIVVAGMGYLGAMSHQHWRELEGDDKFNLLLGLGLSVLAVISAFLDKTFAKLSSGSDTPPDTGDTVLIARTASSTHTPPIPATLESPAVPETTTASVTTVTTPKTHDSP